MAEELTRAEELLGSEVVKGARIVHRVADGIRVDRERDCWDSDLAVAYVESLSKDDLQLALFAAGLGIALKKSMEED